MLDTSTVTYSLDALSSDAAPRNSRQVNSVGKQGGVEANLQLRA
jgi:hypothetical protein